MEPFASRRQRAFAQMGDGLMVLFAAPVHIRNHDVEHDYRQDSDLFYLTGLREPEACALLSKQGDDEKLIVFLRPRNPEQETWEGRRLGVEGAKQVVGADEAFPIDELGKRLPDFLENKPAVHIRLGDHGPHDALFFDGMKVAKRRSKIGKSYPLTYVDPARILHEMRVLKGKEEVAAMARAAEISAAAHCEAMSLAQPGMYEYEVEAALLQAFRRNGSERAAYGSIVGSGPNATCLHYRENNRQMKDGDLLLIDAGCEVDYFASDITRTFPVNGRFSPEQRDLYEVVLEAQEKGIAAAVVGNSQVDVHEASRGVLVDGLISLGLLKGSADEAIESGSYRKFYMHRTGHYLGMDVHDVGAYYVNGKPRPMEAGMVITIEPGLYCPEADPEVPEAFRGMGIRIEDDILIQTSGPRNLTTGVPKTVAEVERQCQSG